MTRKIFKKISVDCQTHNCLIKDRDHFKKTIGGDWTISSTVQEHRKILDMIRTDIKVDLRKTEAFAFGSHTIAAMPRKDISCDNKHIELLGPQDKNNQYQILETIEFKSVDNYKIAVKALRMLEKAIENECE